MTELQSAAMARVLGHYLDLLSDDPVRSRSADEVELLRFMAWSLYLDLGKSDAAPKIPWHDDSEIHVVGAPGQGFPLNNEVMP